MQATTSQSTTEPTQPTSQPTSQPTQQPTQQPTYAHKRPKNWCEVAKQVVNERLSSKPSPKCTRANWYEVLANLANANAPVLATVEELFGDAADSDFDLKTGTRSILTNTTSSVLCQRLDTLFDLHPSFYNEVIKSAYKALPKLCNAKPSAMAAQPTDPVTMPAHDSTPDNTENTYDTEDTTTDSEDDAPIKKGGALHQIASDYDTADDTEDDTEDDDTEEEPAMVSAAAYQKLRTKYNRLKRKHNECNHTLSFLKELFQGAYPGCSTSGVPDAGQGRKRGRF